MIQYDSKISKNYNFLVKYYIELSIEKFYNNREQDIQGIAEELEFYRKKFAMAKGG